MALDKSNVVVDLKNKDSLKNDEKSKIDVGDKDLDSFNFEEFDNAIEKSFQYFLKQVTIENYDTRDIIQQRFNNWLDQQCNTLDIMKNSEIAQKIIWPITFELIQNMTPVELQKFQIELLEAEKKKSGIDVSLKVGTDELKGLTKVYNNIKKEDIANLFDNNFHNRNHLLDLLKTEDSDNIKKFQRIIAWIDENDNSQDKSTETKRILGNTWVDWMFWKHTLQAFKEYVRDNPPTTESTNERTDTNGSVSTPGATAVSAPGTSSWQGEMVSASADITWQTIPATTKWATAEKPTENPEEEKSGFEFNNNDITTLTEDKATEIVGKAKQLNLTTIKLDKLETLMPEVAKILATFGWELYFSWLEQIEKDVLDEFINWGCKTVHFKWGQLRKNNGEISIYITNDKKYSVNEITDEVLAQLVNWNSTSWSAWSSGENAWSWASSSATTSTSNSQANKKKRDKSKANWRQIGQNSAQEQIEANYEWNPKEVCTHINKEFRKIWIIDSPINVILDFDNTNIQHFSIPKNLSNTKSLSVLYNPTLTQYIKTVDGDQNAFAIPTNIKFWLIKWTPNTFVIWDYEKKDWFLSLNENSDLTGTPNGFPWTDKPSFRVTESNLTEWNEESSEWGEKDDESRNEYHNLEDNKYGEIPAEVVDSNYDALIDYMKWKNNKNLEQAFKRLQINPNSIANTLAQILEDTKKQNITKFERKHISNEAMKQLGRNQKLFVNEKNNLVKILNNVERDKLQQFINEMKVFNDIRELQKTKKFVKMNEEKIKQNPFAVLSDFGKDGTVDTWENWIKHHWRTSEQAMYDVFVSLADTDVFTEKRTNGQSYKTIIDWPKTEDLVKWFVSLIKTVWENRYDDIENEFNWGYTIENLWKYIVNHSETLVLYQQTINGLSYNSSMDIQDLVSDSRRKSIVDGTIKDIKEISTNRDEVNKRFESQLWKNEEFDKRFKALSEPEQKNFIWNMAVWLEKWWLLQTIVKTFWVRSETWVTVDNLNAVDIDFNLFKDDAWIWPRIALVGLLQGGLGFHLDIPIVNLTANFDLNHRAVENSVIHGVNPVHQLYTRLWANVWWWIVLGWKTDEKLSAHFSAAIEWAVWWKADYKKGIELSAQNFGNVLQNGIFKDPDFSSKEWFKQNAKKSIEDIMSWTDKENKNLRKFMKNNKQEMFNCVDNVSNLLDVMWAFDPDKKSKHKKILLDSIMKWIVEEVKNQNLWELDGKTRLTRVWVFGQVWVWFDAKKLFQWDFKWAFWAGWSVWLEATLSAWNMIYLPDKEKYEYMDAQLKSGESIKSLGEGIKTNNIENMKNAIAQSLSENSIPNINVESNSKSQIEISVTDTVLQKYNKNNIYELFNIYVNPEKKDNVAISENGKTLTLGWNNLENFSVATRRYFDDFAVYLMIWWKWIDGCGNNKINDETVWEYNTAWHFENVRWFEFKEPIPEYKEETQSLEGLFESYNELNTIFNDIEKQLSQMDNWEVKNWRYAAFMNAAADANLDGLLDSDYDSAFAALKNLLKWKLNDPSFDWLKWKLEDQDITIWEKVMIVDRFKAIFSYNDKLVNPDNLKLQLKWRWDKYKQLHWYDRTVNFPLVSDIDYRKAVQEQLNSKGTFTKELNKNLLGLTAFYRLGDKNAWRSYMMTELWWTYTLWWVTMDITDDIDLLNAKDWLEKNIDKSGVHKEILKASLTEKIKRLLNINDLELSDENLKQLLKWEFFDVWNNIDNWKKKVRINMKYVFYLLWECANESIWAELTSITVVTENVWWGWWEEDWEDNVLEIWVDGQTLTKTESLNENRLNIKENIVAGGIGWWEPNDAPWSQPGEWDDNPWSYPGRSLLWRWPWEAPDWWPLWSDNWLN